LCWRYKEQLDWIVKPWLNEEQEITYLVEPRLIEEVDNGFLPCKKRDIDTFR
jgi:hypothetical protein